MQKHRPLALVMSVAASLPLAAIALYTAVLTPRSAIANDLERPPPAVHCGELATDPRHGLAGNPTVKAVTSQVVPAAGVNASFCQVDILFGTNPAQNINVRVGLPLAAADGGTGGIQGAGNGRTQGVGGGGCAGNLNVIPPVNG